MIRDLVFSKEKSEVPPLNTELPQAENAIMTGMDFSFPHDPYMNSVTNCFQVYVRCV
jgi:hypothetical protein